MGREREIKRKREINHKEIRNSQYNCSLPLEQCPAHHQAESSRFWPSLPSLCTVQDIPWYGMEYPFGQFSSAVLGMLPPGLLCTCSLAEPETLRGPWIRVRTTQQQQKHPFVISIAFILNPEHRTVSATKMKISYPNGNKTKSF